MNTLYLLWLLSQPPLIPEPEITRWYALYLYYEQEARTHET